MKWDLNDLPSNVIIQASKEDLLAMVEKILSRKEQYLTSRKKLEQDEILDFKEMCAFLKIAAPTGYAKTSKGEIPHFKRGRKLFFKKSDLLKWLEEGRRKTKRDLDEIAEVYLKRSK